MNAQTAFQTANLSAWDEAFRRVESCLRSHGIESRVQLNLQATDIIAAARQLAEVQPAIAPVTLAMQITEERICAWCRRILMVEGEGDERFHARARLALIMADVPVRWPQHFLAAGPIPRELIEAMQACSVQPGPEVVFTNMAPQPIELHPTPHLDALRSSFNRRTLFRAVALWVVIIGILGATWAASH